MNYFGLESYPAKFPYNFSPMLTKKVLEKNDEFTIFLDEYGLTQKVLAGGTSVPLTLDYPVKNNKDFDNYKALYSGDLKSRMPKDFEKLAKSLKNKDFALRLGGHPFGFSGTARQMKQGGYITHIDHSIPMDADFSKFKEYRTRLNLLIDTL